MTANQFRTALSRLKLSQLEAARIVKAEGRTVRRWAAGDRSVPECVAILLRLMQTGKITAEEIKEAH